MVIRSERSRLVARDSEADLPRTEKEMRKRLMLENRKTTCHCLACWFFRICTKCLEAMTILAIRLESASGGIGSYDNVAPFQTRDSVRKEW